MIKLECFNNEFYTDLTDLVNLYQAYAKNDMLVKTNLNFNNLTLNMQISINNLNFEFLKPIFYYTKQNIQELNDVEIKRIKKRFAKNCLYSVLCKVLKKSFPWGSLTGVKPIRMIRGLIETEKLSREECKIILKQDFKLSDKKIDLAFKIIDNEPKIECNNNNICVYVNIPFCPEKCTYCSFISRVTREDDKILEEYVKAVINEIRASESILKNKNIKSLYVGGGTPSILNYSLLETLLKELSKIKTEEFVYECGRADTIDEKKLALLKTYGVKRICINPQTFNQKVLKVINRNISNLQVLENVKKAKTKFIINCDLIAGLPSETFLNFKKSINKLCELEVDNISVHSLAIKRTSDLFTNNSTSSKTVEKMLNYAIKKLDKKGYYPYYLYRLKNTYNGLENIGFAKKNTQCLFNIFTMDEYLSVVAFGANGISKKIDYKTGAIERVENPKDVSTYLKNLDKYISRKNQFFK